MSSLTNYAPYEVAFNHDVEPSWAYLGDDDYQEAQDETRELIESTRRSLQQTKDNQ